MRTGLAFIFLLMLFGVMSFRPPPPQNPYFEGYFSIDRRIPNICLGYIYPNNPGNPGSGIGSSGPGSSLGSARPGSSLGDSLQSGGSLGVDSSFGPRRRFLPSCKCL
ncbi:uncharacterized protein LOC122503474 [Leptopilina heterotoma]|uniref:uncharacterized protein LOC122503474 n=1 Tax=Leptopilina heterotoma TaxID=63436 RepID=UPI001CA7F9E5|nr:uncharacterized protein LOC122503474 [Leptopilina heterotoma]